jgi:hypothetical protein
MQPNSCPCHPGEIRDKRFAFLDELISAGWGSVPMYVIERELIRNKGVLGPAPKSPDDVATDMVSR